MQGGTVHLPLGFARRSGLRCEGSVSLPGSTGVNVFPLMDVAVASPCSTTPPDFEHLFLSDALCAL
ncbi:hypothetical protein PL81_08145 [Streptomyces sp. RSD-27]|nr:hypothetical protein PL81_08145 [Streptomyces sp. RSD-27]